MNGPKRGELYRLKKRGADGKARPVLVVSRDALNRGHSLLVVPFYSQQLDQRSTLPWCSLFQIGEGGLDRKCVAKADELSRIDKLLVDLAAGPIGQFNPAQMGRVVEAMLWALQLDRDPRKRDPGD